MGGKNGNKSDLADMVHLVKSQHYLEIGQSIGVVRLENERRADARVAWYGRKQDGEPRAGIEFLGCDNF